MAATTEKFLLAQDRGSSFMLGGVWLIMGIAFAYHQGHVAKIAGVFIVAGASILCIAYLFKSKMVFYEDVVLLSRGLRKWNRLTEIPYNKIDYVKLIQYSRASSFVIKASNTIRSNPITYSLFENLNKEGEKEAFVKFLNSKGVNVISNDDDYLSELFGHGFKVLEWDYHGQISKMYYVPGLGKPAKSNW